MGNPSRGLKFFFWFLLAVFSTFFAEVTVGSAPLVFFKPDGWLLTVPVYGLHILVLAPLVIRPGRQPAWQSLYLAGTIFGLYEAYITKILWAPTWNPQALQFAGLAVFETLLLVFFWHPVMAFLVPLVFTENFLGLSPRILPGLDLHWNSRLSNRRFYLIVGGLIGFVLGALIGEPGEVVLVTLLNSIFIGLLIFLWEKYCATETSDWQDLLPGERAWIFFVVLLALDFFILGAGIRPQAIPSLDRQAAVWILYAVLGWFTWRARNRQVEVPTVTLSSTADSPDQSEPLKFWLAFAIPFCLLGVGSSLFLAAFKNFFSLAISALGIPCGIILLIRSLKWLFNKNQPDRED